MAELKLDNTGTRREITRLGEFSLTSTVNAAA